MTDTNQTQEETPVVSEMDNNLMSFLDPSFNPEASALDEAAVADAAKAADATTEAQAEVNPQVTPPAQAEASNAPVVETPQTPKPDEVDAALLQQMLTIPGVAPVEQQPVQQPVQQTPAEEPVFKPFANNFQLPAPLQAALFESDDPQVRAQALVDVMVSVGNSVAAVMEARIKEHYVPKITQQAEQRFTQNTEVKRIDTDFYSTYPELEANRPLVTKAFQIVAAKLGTGAVYNAEVKAQVGALAKKALAATGVQVAQPTQQQTSQPKPAAKPKTTPYVAGGARPGNYESPDPNTAAAMFDELSKF